MRGLDRFFPGYSEFNLRDGAIDGAMVPRLRAGDGLFGVDVEFVEGLFQGV